jgi:hypothetical protein
MAGVCAGGGGARRACLNVTINLSCEEYYATPGGPVAPSHPTPSIHPLLQSLLHGTARAESRVRTCRAGVGAGRARGAGGGA